MHPMTPGQMTFEALLLPVASRTAFHFTRNATDAEDAV